MPSQNPYSIVMIPEMKATLIYGSAVGGCFLLLLLVNINRWLGVHVYTPSHSAIVRNLAYPFLYGRNRFVDPISRLDFILQLIYWTGTLAFNIVGVNNFLDASKRAAEIAIVHLVPLLAGSRLSLAADALGLPFRTWYQVHKTAGLMVFVQSMAHTILLLKAKHLTLDLKSRFGLVVS